MSPPACLACLAAQLRCLPARMQGLMRKRIASINEAPIAESERRIAVDEPAYNTWLADQVCGWRHGQPRAAPSLHHCCSVYCLPCRHTRSATCCGLTSNGMDPDLQQQSAVQAALPAVRTPHLCRALAASISRWAAAACPPTDILTAQPCTAWVARRHLTRLITACKGQLALPSGQQLLQLPQQTEPRAFES